MVTVDNPAIGADTVAPEKLIAVIDVPTDDPPCFNSTPEITPVKFAPDPTNDVAVSAPDEELKVRLVPDFAARAVPVAAVANSGKQVVSLDSSATLNPPPMFEFV